MKLLLVGDLHARADKPEKRLDDDFMETVLDKLEQILEIAEKHSCLYVLQAGDWHNSFSPDKLLIAKEMSILKREYPIRIVTIHGQHDMKYHSQVSTKNSALRILEASGSHFWVLDGSKSENLINKDVLLHAAPYGKVPTTKPVTGCFNILMSHVMVMDKPLYINQEFISPSEYMTEYPGYDLYFVGDIHKPFVSKRRGSIMINAGSVLRLSIDQKDYKPKVVVFDTETKEYEDIYLKIEENVFDLTVKKHEKDNKFVDMIQVLKDTGRISVNFKDNLDLHIRKNKIKKEIVGIIDENYYNIIERN